MISVNSFFEKISYGKILAPLLEALAENFPDFASDQRQYQKSISELRGTVTDLSAPSVEEVEKAVEQQIGTELLFAFSLGLKANLDHFANPGGCRFLDADPEVYLREDAAKDLPDYQSAQRVRLRFRAALAPGQQEQYRAILDYICHLETLVPKLAHYYGYMLGNQLFPHIVPGYREDLKLTAEYRQTLEAYLGVELR